PYEREAGELLKDPWGARDAYVDVVLARSAASDGDERDDGQGDAELDAFFARHAKADLGADGCRRALELLELQRHAMLMYTSCSWFFDEISGIETVQVLQYAGRAIHLAERRLGIALEAGFHERLAAA